MSLHPHPRFRTSLRLLAALCATLHLSACDKPATDSASSSSDPVVQGHQIRFPSTKPLVGLASEKISRSSTRVLSFPGRLIWDEDQTVRVFPAIAGRVVSVQAVLGQTVQAGAELATLTAPDLGAAQADSRKAEADSQLARATLARQKELLDAGIVARKDYEQAEADARRSEAERQRAQSHLAQLGGSATVVDQHYHLLSPLAGVVVERNINPGLEVRTDGSTPALFTVTDPHHLWLLLDVNESSSNAFHAGDLLHVHSQALPDAQITATVTQVSDFIDPVTRTLKVRARVDNPQRLLKAEMYVTADLDQPTATGIYVPSRSVYLNDGHFYVFADLGGNRYEQREVRVGAEINGSVPVLSGLQEGEQVVTAGSLYLAQILRDAASAAH